MQISTYKTNHIQKGKHPNKMKLGR